MIEVLEHPRVETLFAALAEELRLRPQGPLCEEVVVVESLGMARRLPLELATRLGSAARLSAPFPARYLWNLLLEPTQARDALAPWESGALAWRIADLLAEDAAGDGVAARLLSQDRDGRLRHDLARRLADLFDQYLVHRPGLLLDWEGHRDSGLAGAGLALPETPELAWQRGIWRRLCEGIGRPHRAALLADALARLEAGLLPEKLPGRISLFALCGLPADQLKAFSLLSRHLPVCLYLQSPSFDYWGDLPRRARIVEDELLRSQAPLLAADGLERGRWIDQLLEEGADFSNLPGVPASPRTTLERLQQAHVELAPLPRPVATDFSLQFHSCHTTARQAEVLVDRLLDLFQRLPGLEPGDVLVLCPDLEAARPALEAALVALEERQIPWRLLEQPAGGLAMALGQVLELLGGRWPSAAVLAPLACPALRRRLGIEAGDLPVILQWCRDTGVRWGWDAATRAALDLPATDEHGWRAGLDRLLLGYAMGEESEVAGRLPLPAAGLEEPARLQAWLAWPRLLRRLEAAAAEPRPPEAWAAWLRAELPRLFAPDEGEERELQQLRETLGRLEVEARHGSALAVPLAVMRDALLPRLGGAGGMRGGGGFDGRLTVAPMLAGRLLPARVVVLLGLEDQVFPRPGDRDELDLCLARPLPGDRHPREQDRAQFLDALHSARDALLIFWNGRDPREDTPKPPSLVVSELLTVLGRPDPGLPHPAVVEHPLQGFSPGNYGGAGEERSFHVARARAATRLQWARQPGRRLEPSGPAFLEALPLPAPPAELTLDELVRFYANPARAFLRRAGVALPWEMEELEESEPFASDPLDQGLLRRAVLEGLRRGDSQEQVERRLRAAGRLPWGRAGRVELEGAVAQVTPLLEEERRFLEGGPALPIELDLRLADLRLRGGLEAVGEQRLELSTRSSDNVVLMETWLRHLAWCCHAGGTSARVTRLLCRNDELLFRCPPDPQGLLAVLLQRWREGQSIWLPWLPAVSETIAESIRQEPEAALVTLAERDWCQGREYLLENPWLQLALGEADPFTHPQLAPRVAELALVLGAPLREALA